MSHLRPLFSHCGPVRALGALAVAALLGTSLPARAQGPATLYKQAQTREQTVTGTDTTTLAELRAAARVYEGLVLRYPSSGYADDALWQAAGLMDLAFAKSGAAADRDKIVKLLTWLRREYPTSKLLPQVNSRLAALHTPAVKATATPDAPTPAVVTASPPVAPPPPPRAAGQDVQVRNISRAALPRGDRITIELSHEVDVQSDRVSNPDRVFFDFPNATAAASLLASAREIHSPFVKSVRVGRPTAGVTRVVLELAGTPRYSAFPLYGPFRLVVDLEGEPTDPRPPSPVTSVSPPAAVAAGAPPGTAATSPAPAHEPPASPSASAAGREGAPDSRAPARGAGPVTPPLVVTPGLPAITSKGDYSMARQLGLGISRIVIDAGHGGHDPGAQANGIDEAELVLDVSLRLQRLLSERPGFDVVLTRKTDEFIPLEERTAIANREGADLFLSIHANASRQTTARGVETYILNFATNPAAEAVAARENATSAQTMGTLPAILKAIALNNKLAESRELATILQTSLVRKLRPQNQGLKDLGVKQAPFVVLIGAQMPSVLAEISFLTNRSEAALLKRAAYRQQIAQALCDAIVRYQSSLKKITTVASR